MMNQYNNPDYCFCNQPGGDCEDMTYEEWDCFENDTGCENVDFCRRLNVRLDQDEDFRTKLLNLNNLLAVNYESKVVKLKNGTIIEDTGNENNPYINLPILGSPYTQIAHTHPDNNSFQTYSVFSFADMRRFSELTYHGKIKTGKFVAYLTTAKETQYALTIDNPSKLKDFFYHWNTGGFGPDASLEEKSKWFEAWQGYKDLGRKYYGFKDDPPNSYPTPLIQDNNSDNEMILEQFLSFMAEADLGVTLYESDDTSFENFKKISLNNGSVEKEEC